VVIDRILGHMGRKTGALDPAHPGCAPPRPNRLIWLALRRPLLPAPPRLDGRVLTGGLPRRHVQSQSEDSGQGTTPVRADPAGMTASIEPPTRLPPGPQRRLRVA